MTSLILGARNEEQLQDNLASLDLELTAEEKDRIEEITRPEAIYPYWHRAMTATDRPDPAEEPFLENFKKTVGV